MPADKKEWWRNLARNAEEKLFVARCLDCVRTVAAKKKASVLTDFLDPGQAGLLEHICHGYGGVRVFFWGGYHEAERRRAMVFAADREWPGEDCGADCQVGILQVIPLSSDSLPGHRDYLGSLTGLGVNRDKIGDIVRQEKGAAVFAASEILPFLRQNWQSAGRCPVTTQLLNEADFQFEAPELVEKVVTAASPRLDALVGKTFHLSRAEASSLVRQGKVKLNWRQQVDPAKQVLEGDLISCRGYGRFRVLRCAGRTKKAREKFILGFAPEYNK